MVVSFGTKAETLERLAKVLKKSVVLPQVRFTVGEWHRDEEVCLKRLVNALGPKKKEVIIRSSAMSEDTLKSSNAGHYQSVPGVTLADRKKLKKGIRQTIRSYGDAQVADNQVFVQPFLKNVMMSGVVFTRDIDAGGPYFCINYDDFSHRTDSVTSGKVGHLKTYIQFKGFPTADPRFKKLIEALKEAEISLDCDAVDVEFAIGKDGRVYLLQARPLAVKEHWGDSHDLSQYLQKIHKKVVKLNDRHPYLFGSRTILGVMPDWNPAEMIGVKPRPLALSLYKQLITDRTWAYQRDNYGYKNLRSYPLMVTLVGHPYIDVRVSVNSFIPKHVSDGFTERLADYYLDRLEKNPASHDKIEFDVIFSCFYFGIDKKLQKLRPLGFSQRDINIFRKELLNLTNGVLKGEGSVFHTDIERIETLKVRQEKILRSSLPVLDKIYWLCEDCCRYGTLPFAGLARAAFIAIQLLRSLIEVGFLSPDEFDAFMGSLKTVAKQLPRDLAALPKKEFLGRYGHLRPGTYDILSTRYDAGYELYFDKLNSRPSREKPFRFPQKKLSQLDSLLRKSGLKIGAAEFVDFLKKAIEAREFSKFIFTKSVSETLELIAGLCARYGISREDASFLDIRTLLGLYATVDHRDLEATLREEINRNKRFYEVTKLIKMPSLIVNPGDVYRFELLDDAPNFITLGRCRADVVREASLLSSPLKGKIVCLRCADPGYDWIFSKSIAGLITLYGGSNSHMAIRAAELKIPAVIGAGEKKYHVWEQAEMLEIDSANRIVRVIR